MPTVIARPLSETEKANREDTAKRELLKLLTVMKDNPSESIATMAERAGWTLQGGAPYKSKVQRHLATLHKQKLVGKELDTWALTTAGEKAAKRGAK